MDNFEQLAGKAKDKIKLPVEELLSDLNRHNSRVGNRKSNSALEDSNVIGRLPVSPSEAESYRRFCNCINYLAKQESEG